MIRNIFLRGLAGIPIGIMIQQFIGIISSLVVNDGNYYPVVPFAVETFGTVTNTVIGQVLLSSLMGFIFSASSLIWENTWSLTKQTITVFCIYISTMLPIAWILKWMHPSLSGVLMYIGIFILIFISIWIGMYFNMKAKIKELNEGKKLKGKN